MPTPEMNRDLSSSRCPDFRGSSAASALSSYYLPTYLTYLTYLTYRELVIFEEP